MTRFVTALVLFTSVGLSSACTAIADPQKPVEQGKFPDISSYAPVNADDYMWQTDNPGRPNKITTYGFSTPDGIGCTFGESSSASCTGNNFPTIPAAHCDPAQGTYGENEISTDTGLRKISDTGCASNALSKVLPPFHTLTVYGVTCGVDDKGTTACKDPQGRGFVLSPSWSGWIPKV
jgi:hypothetical protein